MDKAGTGASRGFFFFCVSLLISNVHNKPISWHQQWRDCSSVAPRERHRVVFVHTLSLQKEVGLETDLIYCCVLFLPVLWDSSFTLHLHYGTH